jgi:hypothetical protein
MEPDRSLHSLLREARAVAAALTRAADGPPDPVAEGLARLRDLTTVGLHLLGRDPDVEQTDALIGRLVRVLADPGPDPVRGPPPSTAACPVPGPHPPGSTPYCPERAPDPPDGRSDRPARDPADDFLTGWRAGAPTDLPPRPPTDHVHSWPNPYRSCTCGERPPASRYDGP